MRLLTILFFCTAILTTGCKKDNSGEWLIPQDEVLSGGPGVDGIPSIDITDMATVSDISYMNDEDLVVGIIHDGEARAYPHKILDWHEIINDQIGDQHVAITYCPLTGTAVGWDREIDGDITTFGVSGKLYNTNLIPFDRKTRSYWSQIGLNCVTGELISREAVVIPLVETTWKSWKEAYPNSLVQTLNTGFSRNYGLYPYGDYRTNDDRLIFPISNEDNRLPRKERVLGVFNNDITKAYSIKSFTEPKAVFDDIDGQEYIIIGSEEDNFIRAFINNGLTDLSYVNELPVIAEDSNGNRINFNGEIIAGPLEGTQLQEGISFIGYWFSFGAFYPEISIYQE